MKPDSLSSRERVRLALEHRETDRVPIAMVCSGINEPALSVFEAFLVEQGHASLGAYLDPLLDIATVGPDYIGPRLEPGTDVWGVHRSPISYGPAEYDEIDRYPLARIEDVSQLDSHRWPWRSSALTACRSCRD